jgi:NAD(P)-dependent dehydrogenase (short-subunit alcohol dehydrogenase family)
MKLHGQVAIVVGAARGIGKAIALRFATEGAQIVLVDLEALRASLDEAALQITHKGAAAIAMVADATNEAQINQMVGEVVRRWGKIDVLVNSAGFRGPMVPVHEISDEEWDKVLAVNLKAVFVCCKAVVKQMMKQRSGSIVTISGTAGKEGMALRGSLCAAKWGVLGLTQTLAKEAGPFGIRANVICPGGVDEEELRDMYKDRAQGLGMRFEELEKTVLALTPLRKYAAHDEIASAALFLASSDSSHTTGEALNVSGGRIMN